MSLASDVKQSSNQADEEDVWWGSFSPWAIAPGFLACLLATGVWAWLTWLWFAPAYGRIAFLAAAGALWLVQGFRWGHRVFGYNYRLTTRRLYCQEGFSSFAAAHMELEVISSVAVSRLWHERLVGGAVIVRPKAESDPGIVLRGVYNPAAIAALIWGLCQPPRPV